MVSFSLSHRNLWPPQSRSAAFRGFATAASVHACHHVRRQLRLGFTLRSSIEKLFHRMEFSRVDIRLSPSICFSIGGESKIDPRGEDESSSKPNNLNGRRWTNVLLAINVIMYVAQVASHGKVLAWGAKVNSLIERGQLWRLATSSLLHANPMHLMINCFSLNSLGPTAESLGGTKRFLAIYITSAIASSAMSYCFNKAPSVGASGAIFGLVGSVAVFVIRHKRMVRGGNEDLMQITQIIALNMTMGLVSRGIDNWGHIGGLLGGTAMAWLLGPQWKYQYTRRDGRRVFMDSAPVPLFLRWKNQRGRL